MTLRTVTLADLTIDDESSFRHVGLYDKLKRALIADAYPFRVPADLAQPLSWNRAVFLNLTFWNAREPADVLMDERIPADVVTHAAWHHLCRKALAAGTESAGPPGAEAMFLGESIASAFDLYLVGRLLGHSQDSGFLQTQVPAMLDVAEEAGMGTEEFEALLSDVADEPERAFEDLRELLFDAATALVRCDGVDAAQAALEGLASRRFYAILHHYELSNWVLYARAYGARAPDARALAVDATLRSAPVALDWLEARWLPAE